MSSRRAIDATITMADVAITGIAICLPFRNGRHAKPPIAGTVIRSKTIIAMSTATL